MIKTLYKNTTIAYTDQGKGTVVVLLHGFREQYNVELFSTRFN